MTATLLVLLLLSQAEGPDNPPAGPTKPQLSASPARKWRSLARLETSGLALLPRAGVGAAEGFAQVEPTLGTGGTLLFPEGEGALRPGAFASMGLGVDNAR